MVKQWITQKKKWTIDFVKNVITYVIAQKQITLIVSVRIVSVTDVKKTKLMKLVVSLQTAPKTVRHVSKIYLVLALLFALSACSVGKKCVVTDEGNVVSSYVWFFKNGKPAEIDKMNCFQEEQ